MGFFGGLTDHSADYISPAPTPSAVPDPMTGILAGRGQNPDLSRTGGSAAGTDTGNTGYNPYAPSYPSPAGSSAGFGGGLSGSSTPASATYTPTLDYSAIAQNYQNSQTPAASPAPTSAPTTPAAPASTPAPANPALGVASPYGANPFLSNPTVNQPNGTTANLNPSYYASQSTADAIAKQYGGTVVSTNPYGTTGGFSGNQPMLMVKLPNGTTINPADIAGLYTHGYSQPYIDLQLQTVLNGGQGSPMASGMALDPSIANQFSVTPGAQPGTINTGLTPYGQTGNPALIGQTGSAPAAGQQQNQSGDLNSFLSQLLGGGQQQSQGDNPLLGLVSQLYGSNPFTAAFGNSGLGGVLGNLLSGSTNSNNMGNIAQLLNAIYAQRNQPGSGIMSPLFWGAQGSAQGTGGSSGLYGNPNANYYSNFF